MIEQTEEEGREAACEFGEIGENCDFTSPRKRTGVLIGVCELRLLRQADATGIPGQLGCIHAKHAIRTHNDRPLNGILQFANIARRGIGPK
jgi:hypothetical protein